MKLQLLFLSFLMLINATFNKACDKKETLLKILTKEHWTVSVCTSPFRTNTLALKDASDPDNITEQKYPLCSEEEAKEIEESLSASFNGLPFGYPDCLRSILTGANETELLVFTKTLATIQDKENKRFCFPHPRRPNPIILQKKS